MNSVRKVLLLCLAVPLFLSACGKSEQEKTEEQVDSANAKIVRIRELAQSITKDSDYSLQGLKQKEANLVEYIRLVKEVKAIDDGNSNITWPDRDKADAAIAGAEMMLEQVRRAISAYGQRSETKVNASDKLKAAFVKLAELEDKLNKQDLSTREGVATQQSNLELYIRALEAIKADKDMMAEMDNREKMKLELHIEKAKRALEQSKSEAAVMRAREVNFEVSPSDSKIELDGVQFVELNTGIRSA